MDLVLAARAVAGARSAGVVTARAGRHVEDVGEENFEKVIKVC